MPRKRWVDGVTLEDVRLSDITQVIDLDIQTETQASESVDYLHIPFRSWSGFSNIVF